MKQLRSLTRLSIAAFAIWLSSCKPAVQQRPQPVADQFKPPDAINSKPSHVLMKNVFMRNGPACNVHVQSLDGYAIATRQNDVASFDDKTSFRIQIKTAVLMMTPRDLAALLNGYLFASPHSPLSGIKASIEGNQLIIRGLLHKGMPLPIEITADLSATSDNRLRVHPTRLAVVHMPVRKLMHAFGISMASLVDTKTIRGVSADKNDLLLVPSALFPPPSIDGALTRAYIQNGEVMLVFGGELPAQSSPDKAENFISFQGGAIQFEKLRMIDSDLRMVGADPGRWFIFNLDHYREQLTASRVQVTEAGGLRVAMVNDAH